MVSDGKHRPPDDVDKCTVHLPKTSTLGRSSWCTPAFSGCQSASTSGSAGSPSSRSEQAVATTPASDSTFVRRLNHLGIKGDEAGSSQGDARLQMNSLRSFHIPVIMWNLQISGLKVKLILPDHLNILLFHIKIEGLQNLIQRNEQLHGSGDGPSSGVALPFILVQVKQPLFTAFLGYNTLGS
ncbi:Transcription factor-like protein DPB [Apostasia shenzhenica]|uniref:Transcription factor-like protein DPB n=1 Tax=Apostasia shenzhenica TaxID=1088818 RepID=A0A2I0AHM9_9ASPA|nr:Transcription factor-like protein DPB [Apostasia shenzhenica]